MLRGPRLEISASRLRHNFRLLKDLVGKRAVICVIKADAYGHGMVECAREFAAEGANMFGVAYNEEAIGLRQAGVEGQVIVFFDEIDIEKIIKYKLTPIIYNVKSACEASKWALKYNVSLNVHINVDTGMGRVGFLYDLGVENIKKVLQLDNINVVGFMSHFSEADLIDRAFAYNQLERFMEVKKELSDYLKQSTVLWHMSNSAASLTLKEAYLDAIRPGIALYGYSPLNYKNGAYNNIDLRPVMTVKTNLIEVRNVPAGRSISYCRTFITKRDSVIGVLPMGYADGYQRILSNNAFVLVRGQRASIVGRICMDTIMVDLTDISGVDYNDEVVLIGKQMDNSISANELAVRANTISYEVLTTFGRINKKTLVE
ncbi:MAG: alanine racemase [Candidatus Magnetoovum sp. WYHC-5]|nr:alanine racemase [Candidatus Magnetoovum sp. WYHC-5]